MYKIKSQCKGGGNPSIAPLITVTDSPVVQYIAAYLILIQTSQTWGIFKFIQI